MKKLFIILLIFILASPIFAEEEWRGNRRSAITLNPIPLVTGPFLGGFGIEAGFEYAISRPFSIKGEVSYLGFDPTALYFEGEPDSRLSILRLSAEARWYPSARYVHGFYVNGGVQFHRLAASSEWLYEADDFSGNFNTWSAFLGIGYKFVFGRNRTGFIIEPSAVFLWDIHSDIPFNEMSVMEANLVGTSLGVRLFRGQLLFGVAF